MQVILKNEVEEVIGREINLIDIIICPRWISRYLKGEYYRKIRNRGDRIQVSKRIFGRNQE